MPDHMSQSSRYGNEKQKSSPDPISVEDKRPEMSNYRASDIGDRPLVNSSLVSQNASHLAKKQPRDLQDYRQINIYEEGTEA